MTLRSQWAWFLLHDGESTETRDTKNTRGPAQKGRSPRLLPSFLRVKDDLQKFQKSKSKKDFPKPGCLFSLGLMREGHPDHFYSSDWTSSPSDGMAFLGVK